MVCTGLLPSNNTPEVSRVREESCVCPLGGGGVFPSYTSAVVTSMGLGAWHKASRVGAHPAEAKGWGGRGAAWRQCQQPLAATQPGLW